MNDDDWSLLSFFAGVNGERGACINVPPVQSEAGFPIAAYICVLCCGWAMPIHGSSTPRYREVVKVGKQHTSFFVRVNSHWQMALTIKFREFAYVPSR